MAPVNPSPHRLLRWCFGAGVLHP